MSDEPTEPRADWSMIEYPKLSPCPFCGSTDLAIFANTVECDGCGAYGPRQEGPECVCDSGTAAHQWNRRAAIQAALDEEQR